MHAFVDAPPAGVKARIARSNGDALLYDAKTNTFAVVTKAGAPRIDVQVARRLGLLGTSRSPATLSSTTARARAARPSP